jgi:hypothetical protein
MALLPAIFTLDVGGRPTLAFEAKNLRESQAALSRALAASGHRRPDVKQCSTLGWQGVAARRSPENETAMYREAVRDAAQTQGDLLLAYLVELDDFEETPDPD